VRFDGHRAKKEHQMCKVKAKAQKTVAAIQKQHAAELHRKQSKNYKQEREMSKRIVQLEGQVKSVESVASKQASLAQAEHERELESQKRIAEQDMNAAKAIHKSQLKSQQSTHYREVRNLTKALADAEEQRDTALAEKDDAIAEKDFAVTTAVREAKKEEREHYSKVIKEQKEKQATLLERISAQSVIATALTERSIAAERQAEKANRLATMSSKRSMEVNQLAEMYEQRLKIANKENATLRRAMNEMQHLLDESKDRLIELESDLKAAVPIPEIRKVRTQRGGSMSWPLYIWDLILEQLVNGTPPSSVSANISAHVMKFSPTTKIKELPSIWTIRRARSVLLVICQTLAAYRLAKAEKWEQLFTDATSRRQVTFQNLIISVEEDELFK